MCRRILIPIIVLYALLPITYGCAGKKDTSTEILTGTGQKDSLFRKLVALTNNSLPETILGDSLAFLILPVQASCPNCRDKTIDSIVKYKDKLAANHFIIISAKGGRKTINGYFNSEDAELPIMENKLFLDTINLAGQYDLYDEKPTMYYTYKKKAYKKVAAIPMTVKQDLQEFFSGYRSETK